jgi:hypothetical protein
MIEVGARGYGCLTNASVTVENALEQLILGIGHSSLSLHRDVTKMARFQR